MSGVLALPELSLVVLVGASGSGKSTFAARHFGRYETVSSDVCRGLVSNDEMDQAATEAAFEVLHFIAGKRLAAGHLTVVDATNVQADSRKQLVSLAREHDVLPVAIVFDVPEQICLERNAARPDRDFGAHVVRRQRDQLRRSMRGLAKEGFRRVHILRGIEEIADATITRERLFNDLRHEVGPFDVIGDVHGCLGELEMLLEKLGYAIGRDSSDRAVDAVHPQGRRAVFVGDLVDRGPDSPGVLRLVMGMAGAGHAFAVPGNHENKLIRSLQGRDVRVSHGLAETLAQLAAEGDAFRQEVRVFCEGLISHLVLDGGRLVVAHAGLKEAYHGRASGRVRSFAMYGDTTGETDEYGLPVRYPWAREYRGAATVLYGHTPVPETEWVNNTLCLDTGCVFGGRLSALRYPERELVAVAAARVYYEPARPFLPAGSQPPGTEPEQREAGLLDVQDVLGKRIVQAAHHGRITVREEQAAGALEVMSRFALEPQWLPYLPPTMAPCAASKRPDVLEHPDDAFAAYRADGVEALICQEKHMGSRAVVLLCRDEAAASARFSTSGGSGAVYTRTGRPFFARPLTEQLLDRLRRAVSVAGLWEELDTSWLLLDCEMLPWSAKAGDLLRNQYAAVGAAAQSALPAALQALDAVSKRGIDVADLTDRIKRRATNVEAYRAAYRRYCWPTEGLDGIRLAPFQVLAAEQQTFHDRGHEWHLAQADRLVASAPDMITPTARLRVDATDETSTAAAVSWWERLTAAGGEGMVVKPLGNLTRSRRGLAQPGIKVRGREYLRIIYGPDYTEPESLQRLRERNVGHKRSLAQREYALGLESLERLVRGEPLWRVHEPVFAVLALESEPIDPRL
ncbi:MAG: polynucleotide kinase-phosphatase [Geodermatophilaceae bacterium]